MVSDATQHTIHALVQDKPGVLNRIASMFRRRGYNISSLSVGRSEQPGLSRMTFVVTGDPHTVEQVCKQMDKLIDVIRVTDITAENIVTRELALIKVEASPHNRNEIIQLVDIFRANIVDVAIETVVIEVTGDESKVDSLVQLLEPFGIRETMRTGRIAIQRGSTIPNA